MISVHFINKYYIKSAVFCAALFFLPLYSIDTKKMVKSKAEPAFLTEAIISHHIFSRLDFKSRNFFVIACKGNYRNFSLPFMSKISFKSTCFKEYSSYCENNYAVCTKGLINSACAKNRNLFTTLWAHHQKEREDELREFYNDKLAISIEIAMNAYSTQYEIIRAQTVKRQIKEKKNLIKKLREAFAAKNEDPYWRQLDTMTIASLLCNNKIDAFEVFPHKSVSQVFKIICSLNSARIVCDMLEEYKVKDPKKCAHYLLKYGHDMVHELAKRQFITINIVDKWGRTALHYEAMRDYSSCIDKLAKAGILINSVDRFGKTALHYACEYNAVQSVTSLLELKGIEISITDSKGKTPLDCIKGSLKKNHDNKVAIRALLHAHALK